MITRKTVVDINGDEFYINGRPVYENINWRGNKIQGLLMNSRMVQATFDDINAETHNNWAGPEGKFDAQKNTDAFIAQLPNYRANGLIAMTLNLQGGNPRGYGADQPWHNSAFEADGSLRDEYMARLEQVVDKCDELGMVIILGYFYFGQDQRIDNEESVISAVKNITDWICDKKYTNVIIEIGNEIDHPRYDHAIIKPDRCDELINLVKTHSTGRIANKSNRLLVSTSFTGAKVTPENIAACADYIIIHGNGVGNPDDIRKIAADTRKISNYAGQPILFNEDDHFDFDADDNNMIASVESRCGWGYFDYRMEGEGFENGFQSVPVDWSISSERKKGFFGLLKEMTRGK